MKPRRLTVSWLTAVMAVIVNLLFIAGYVWSRSGETTHVRFVAHGQTFTAFVDGRQTMSETLDDASPSGGITLNFADQRGVSSLPGPIGVDDVRVTDLNTRQTLLYEDFSGPPPDTEFTVTQGKLSTSGGALLLSDRLTLTRPAETWTDIAVDVTYKNIGETSISLRTNPAGHDVIYAFTVFRSPGQRLILEPLTSDPSGVSSVVQGGPLELTRAETMKSVIAMCARPYLLAVALMLLLAATVTAVSRWAPARMLSLPERIAGRVRLPRGSEWHTARLIALFAFAVTLFLDYDFSAHISHWPDSTSYIFQAKIFASGHVAAPSPPVVPSFDFFYPPLTLVTDGKWASIFPFGHPLMLAIGERIGAVWLVPPVIGALCVVLMFAIGRRIYGTRAGIAAIALLVTSPFFLMQASNFMSHNTAMFYMLVSLLCILAFERNPLLLGAIAGLSFGLLFNTRPLTAVALIPPFGVLLATHLWPATRRVAGARHLAAFAAGGVAMLIAYFLYNYGTSGDFFSSSYQSRDAGQFGFGGAHSVAVGIQNEQTNLAFLLLVMNGWPQYIGLMFVTLPFLLGTRNPWDWFCLSCAVLIMAASVLFSETGVMEGPRFWYEALPFLLFLTVRGAERAAEVAAHAARAVRAATVTDARAEMTGRVLVYGCLAALMAASLYGWLLGQHAGWKVEFVPEKASALRNFNEIDDHMQTLLDRQQPHHALVLVDDCPHWQCYGSVFTLNTPQLDGDVVFAKDIPASNPRLFAAYPDRAVYRANYMEDYLVAYGADITTRARRAAAASAKAPLASQILATLPQPSPTPAP